MSGPEPARQDELLKFIRAEMKAHGIAPSHGKMVRFLGCRSKSTIHRLLIALERRNLVRRHPRLHNSLELLQADDYHVPGCPCLDCAHSRYLAQLKLVEGLKVDPPVAVRSLLLCGKSDSLRMLDAFTRLELLGSKRAAPHKRKTALPTGASA